MSITIDEFSKKVRDSRERDMRFMAQLLCDVRFGKLQRHPPDKWKSALAWADTVMKIINNPELARRAEPESEDGKK